MNAITITQYHVEYVRSDGRNTPGVDVPYAFDSAVGATVTGTATVGFTLGFGETSSFSAAFRKTTGFTPTAYRRAVGPVRLQGAPAAA